MTEMIVSMVLVSSSESHMKIRSSSGVSAVSPRIRFNLSMFMP